MSHGVVPDRIAEGARAGIGPLARRLAGMGISANAVTIAGGVLSIVGAGLLAAGAAASGANLGQPLLLWSSLVALVASFLVPYVRAKAESLGVSASVGPAPREARIVIFLIGLAAWAAFDVEPLFVSAVVALALLSTITFVLRVVHVGRQLSTKER